jgi:O-antigen/teichoic acid export membrane protein
LAAQGAVVTCEPESAPFPSVMPGVTGRPAHARASLWHQPLYRNSTALLVNTAGTSLVGMAFWVLAARRYPASVVGASSAVISVMLVLANAAELNLTSAMVRFLPTAGRQDQRFIVRSYATVAGCGVVVGFVAFPFIRHLSLVHQLFALGPWGAIWFALAIGVWCLFALQDAVAIALRGSTWVAVENTSYGLVKVIVLVAVATTLPKLGIFTSWTIPMVLTIPAMNLVIFGSLLPAHRRVGGLTEVVSPRRFREFITFEYFTGLLGVATSTIIQLLVLIRLGAAENAYFYVVWVTTSAFDIALFNVGSSLVAEAARQPERLSKLTRDLSRHLVMLLAPVIVLLVLGAPVLLRVFGSVYSAHSVELLRLLALAVVPRIAITMWMSINRVRMRVARVFAVQATLTALLIAACAVALDIRPSINVIGLTYLGCQCLVALIILPGLLPHLRSRPDLVDVVPFAGGDPGSSTP